MNNVISGDDIALIEKEFENAIIEMNDSVKALDRYLNKMLDNFSDLKKYWNTEGGADIIQKIQDVSSSVVSSQKSIINYCDVISSSVNGEIVNNDSYIYLEGDDYE